MPRSTPYAAALLALSLAALVACGGDASPTAAGSTSAAATPSTEASPTPSADPTAYDPTAYAEVPDGVELTATGTSLALGEDATAAWMPRQDLVGVVDVSVTQVRRTTLRRSFGGFDLGDLPGRTTPYLVSVDVTDVGESDLGGLRLPIFGVDDSDRLVEATGVPQRFGPCPGGRLPARFGPGDEATSCLVYLLPPGTRLVGAAFVPPRPTDPITWTGDIDVLGADGEDER